MSLSKLHTGGSRFDHGLSYNLKFTQRTWKSINCHVRKSVHRMFSCMWHVLVFFFGFCTWHILVQWPRSVETTSEREKRLRKRKESQGERDRLRRERELKCNEERQARFVGTCKYLVLQFFPLQLWQNG